MFAPQDVQIHRVQGHCDPAQHCCPEVNLVPPVPKVIPQLDICSKSTLDGVDDLQKNDANLKPDLVSAMMRATFDVRTIVWKACCIRVGFDDHQHDVHEDDLDVKSTTVPSAQTPTKSDQCRTPEKRLIVIPRKRQNITISVSWRTI